MSAPLLSIIVIAYDMPRQALITLRSLAADYQQGVNAADYEVILVENRSARNMGAEALAALPGNFRYFLRDEPGVSPAAAINFGFAQARGRFIGLMIDGARMVTPGVVQNVLTAFCLSPEAMVVVPGYHLGEKEQQYHLTHGYTEEKEQSLLAEVDWQQNGYKLFDISCLSGANPNGIFHPFMECNCLFMSVEIFQEIGQADERFDLPGGGALNLCIYRKAALHPRTRLFMLAGEGSFHQLHGGVTTSEVDKRDAILRRQNEQLTELLGEPFRSPTIEPTLLGKIPAPALRYLQYSSERGLHRARRCAERNEEMYADNHHKEPTGSSGLQPFRLCLTDTYSVSSLPLEFSMPLVYMPPSIRHFNPLHMVFSTWVDHLPFGYDLVAALRPKMLVELGTHKGLSYFTFCQAMKENEIDGLCYAIDTFEGDEHTDKYDESVFNSVNNHNRQHYHGFSYLMRMFFEDALRHFSEDSIDLLHIDGFHTYEAVSADFANWYPKVKPGGIILFHDVQARLQDFGAWKFWDEIRGQYETFTFNHGFGLGVLRKAGGDRSQDPQILKLLFADTTEKSAAALRAFYVHASKHLENTRKLKRLTQGTPAKPA